MTADEVERYINQIAFSSAEEFMEKYKNQAIIGHFGLGFYSAFMVADKVEIFTRSYKEGAKTDIGVAKDRPNTKWRKRPSARPGDHDRTAPFGRYARIRRRFEGRRTAAQVLSLPARSHRFRQGEGVERR